MDRRTKKTKAAIYDAFSSLLSEKKYSKITIQEIIDRANIGRSTFYSHFETKDDLLKAMCTDIFDKIFSLNNSTSEKAHDIPSASPNLLAMITHILYHIKENEKNIRGFLGSESGDVFMHYFKGYLSRQIGRFHFNSIPEEAFSIPKDFLLNHISGSFIEMVNWWVENNMKQTPEELTSYYIAVIDPLGCIMIHSEDNN